MHGVADNNQIRRESWLVFAIGLLLFTLGLWHQPFIDFESRFALFAQEMLRHGPALFPTSYGEPYPDYPVAGTLLIWLCSLPFGAVTKFSAIFPTALASAFNLLLIYRLLARHERAWAVLAISLQLMTVTFLAQARSISLDQLVATITLLAFYLAYIADVERRAYLTRWLPLVLLLGFIVRGPLGVLIPAGAVLAYYASTAQWRALLRFALLATALTIVAWGILLALAEHNYGIEFMREVVRMQVVGRLETSDAPKFWYYFSSSFGNFALAYPLAALTALLSLPVLLKQPRDARNRLLLALLAWALLVLIGLSIPHTKKPRYLLPLVPAIAAFAASMWRAQQPRILVWIAATLEKFFLLLPALLLIGLTIARHRLQHHAIDLPWHWLYAALLMCQIGALAIVLRRDKLTALSGLSRPALLSIVAALTVWSVNLLAVEPVLLQKRDTATFVRQVEAQRRAQPAPLALFGMLRDGQAIKYMVNIDYDLQPIIVADAAALAALREPTYVAIDDRLLQNLPAALTAGQRVALRGRFDNRDFSLLLFVPRDVVPSSSPP
jgi:4-amino-4-deoxy-L-arabinose transferase-like glycosyltransferase